MKATPSPQSSPTRGEEADLAMIPFKNILIINTFGIGDVLFATPLIRALRRAMAPGGRISFICNKRTYPILAGNKNIDEAHVFEKDHYRELWKDSKTAFAKELFVFLNNIRRNSYDCAFDISLGRQSSFLLKIFKVPVRAGFDYKGRGVFLTHKIPISGFKDKPVAEYYLDLCRIFGIVPDGERLEFPLSSKDFEEAETFLKHKGIEEKEGFFAVIPGGGESWGSDATYKRWSPEGFGAVSDAIAGKHGLVPILIGSLDELRLCESISRLMKNKSVVCAGLSLGGFAALLKKSRVVICNDGGPLHVAVSQGVKTVSIFGPVDEKVYGPYPESRKNIVVKNDVECRPCYRDFRYRRCGHKSCLTGIAPETVIKAAEILL